MNEPEFMAPVRALLLDLKTLLDGEQPLTHHKLQSVVDRHEAMTLPKDRQETIAEEFDGLQAALVGVFDEAQVDGHSGQNCRGDATDLCIDALHEKTQAIVARVFVDPQPLLDEMFDRFGRLQTRCDTISNDAWRNVDTHGRKNVPGVSRDAASEMQVHFRELLIKHGAYAHFH